METTSFNPATAGSRAISIPLHSSHTTSSRHLSKQNSRRPQKAQRLDSDIGNASESSLNSDWTSSPMSASPSSNLSSQGLRHLVPSPSSTQQAIFEPITPHSQRQYKGKQRAASDDSPPNTLPLLFTAAQSPLGPSMLSSSAYKSVNLNSHHDPDSKEPPRLITYTKYSQGFTWNDELFLPSYLLSRHRYRSHGSGARRRWDADDDEDGLGSFDEDGERCPVTDIFVTDEEAAAMMP